MNIKKKEHRLKIGNLDFDFSKRTYIMGVLNVTPDSFFDGGRFNTLDRSVKQALSLQKQGADIIDIGGESTRPGSKKVSVFEETERVLPAIQAIKNEVDIPISIDSCKSEVIEAALKEGARAINDISGLRDEKVRKLAVKNQAAVIIMHMQGSPQNMQNNPSYGDVIKDIYRFLEKQGKLVENEGLDKSKIIVDPGIGFGKRVEDNVEIISRLEVFKNLGYPLLIGVSNKSFIGAITGANVNERLFGTIASNCIAAFKGANIVRVHDVTAAKQALQIVDAIKAANNKQK